jgi:hypothetical protein
MVAQAVSLVLQSLPSSPVTPLTYHVVDSGAVTTVPVTDLLKPAKAKKRLTEQKAKPIARRELKKAA